jgi:hypothetical protein
MQVLDQDYEWVFGSDVTYSEEMLAPLAKLMRQLVLTGENSVIKLAHMHRNKELDKAMREAFHGESGGVWTVGWLHSRHEREAMQTSQKNGASARQR